MSLVIEQSTTPLEAVFESFRGRVVAYARKVAGPDLAEDVAQEVFLRLLTYKRNNLGTITFSFILTMTRNVAMTMLHQRARIETVRTNFSSERASSAATFNGPPDGAMTRRIASKIDELPERQRDVFMLTEVCGLSEEQASRALDMTRAAVSARRRAAIDSLKSRVEPESPERARRSSGGCFRPVLCA